MSKQTYTFICPMCSKKFTRDEPGEPCCTGPNESLDEHELIVMRLLSVNKTGIHPEFAAQRATGQLIMPYMEDEINKEMRLLKC